MNMYKFLTQEEIMLEEEKANVMLEKMCKRYGFENTKTITLAWYVENMDIANVERVFDMLY